MTASRAVLLLAHQISDDMLAQHQQWLDECAEDYRRGHRAHYCEHGTDRWTDYDNICGRCEDGWSVTDGVARRTAALAEARDRVDKYDQIVAWWHTARSLDVSLTVDFDQVQQVLTRTMLADR